MLIERHLHHKWKLMQQHKDIAEINRQTGVERIKISHALNHAWADEKTFVAVNNFYEQREKLQSEIRNKNAPF